MAPPVPFTAVSLLRKSPVDRSRKHRLRDLLLLAARVAALLLLAGSFARPYLAGAPPTGRTTSSPSTDRSAWRAPARFERARALAREAIDQAQGDRVALVAFDDRADVVSAAGTAADARAALASLTPGFGATRYAAVFDKAAELLKDETHAAGWSSSPTCSAAASTKTAPCCRKGSTSRSATRAPRRRTCR